jgi:hypothetical protein
LMLELLFRSCRRFLQYKRRHMLYMPCKAMRANRPEPRAHPVRANACGGLETTRS